MSLTAWFWMIWAGKFLLGLGVGEFLSRQDWSGEMEREKRPYGYSMGAVAAWVGFLIWELISVTHYTLGQELGIRGWVTLIPSVVALAYAWFRYQWRRRNSA